VQYKQDGRDDNQRMNPATGSWKRRTDVPAQKTKQPKYKKNDDNCPNHGIFPIE